MNGSIKASKYKAFPATCQVETEGTLFACRHLYAPPGGEVASPGATEVPNTDFVIKCDNNERKPTLNLDLMAIICNFI